MCTREGDLTEANVDLKSSVINQVEDITCNIARIRVIEEFRWLLPWRWECQVSFDIFLVATAFMKTLKLLDERLVKIEHVVVLEHVGNRYCLFLGIQERANARVVDQGTREVVIGRVILIQHCCRNVRYISSGVRFPSDVDLVILDAKYALPIFEPRDKVCSNILFARSIGCAGGKACSDRLLYP